MKELMKAFATLYSFFYHLEHADGTTNHAASRNNVVLIGTELGGSCTVSQECLQISERGIKGLLQACGVIQAKTQIPATQPECSTQLISVTTAMQWRKDVLSQ